MNHITRRIAALTILASLVALVATPSARAQPQPQPANPQQQIEIPGSGTELFRALLDRAEIQPLTRAELNFRRNWANEDLIVIVIGSVEQVDVPPRLWMQFALQSHGAVLLATDSPTSLKDKFGFDVGQITGDTVQVNRADDCYRNLDDCPYAVPVSPKEHLRANEQPGRVWDLFRGLNKLATNQPSYIEMKQYGGEYQYPLAKLPKSSSKDTPQFRQVPIPNPVFAVGGDGPPNHWGGFGYSFLAVADSSIYINQMIMERETDNLEFALRTIEYLQGPNKHRKRCLFIENGRVVDKFDGLKQAMQQQGKIPPDQMPNLGPLIEKNQDKLVDMANRLADHIQNKDALHNMLVGREGSPEERTRFGRWIEGVAIALSIVISFILLRRTLTSRASTNIPPPPSTGAGAASTGPPGVFERRQKELVRRNNLYEPVRNLMREFFESIGAPTDPDAPLPRIIIDHRRVRKPESLRHAVRDMWRIAYGPPVYLSAQRWFEVEPYFERLRQAHADKKWRFATDEDA